jgi:hypothetical protein
MERIVWVAWRGEDLEAMALVVLLVLEMAMDTVLVRETELVRQKSHALETLRIIGAHVILRCT